MDERELISSLTKVILDNEQKLTNQPFYQDHVYYNAYEKDIAIVNIFFGDTTGFGESQSIPHILTDPWLFVLQNLNDRQR